MFMIDFFSQSYVLDLFDLVLISLISFLLGGCFIRKR